MILLVIVLILPVNAKNDANEEFRKDILDIIETAYNIGAYRSEQCSKIHEVNTTEYANCLKTNLDELKSDIEKVDSNDRD